jgi:uncharacterized membrane protein
MRTTRWICLFALCLLDWLDRASSFAQFRCERRKIRTGAAPRKNHVHPSSLVPVLATRHRPQNTLSLSSSSSTALQSSFLSIANLQTCRATLHADPTFVLSSILLLSTFGITLERKTIIGKALSAPLSTMALALLVANLGFVPFSSPIYTLINRYLVPLAVPMLLFDSDMKRVIRDTGSLLIAFFVGAIATIVGTVVAYPLLPLTSLGEDIGWRVACALAARHIGGAINFVAVADTLSVPGTAVSAAIAADNLVVALYFGFLFYISKPGEPADSAAVANIDERKVSTVEIVDPEDVGSSESEVSTVEIVDPEDVGSSEESLEHSPITLSSLGAALSVSSCLVTSGGVLTRTFLPPGTSSLPLTSILTVVCATVFPKFFSQIRAAGTAVGITFIQMFFAASGAAGSISLVLRSAPSLFAFSALQIGVHFCTLMTLGRGLLRLPPRELYLSSNANVGGPTTAAAMAQAKEWTRLVLPALLIGILGYATATAIALALGPILLRLPIVGR